MQRVFAHIILKTLLAARRVTARTMTDPSTIRSIGCVELSRLGDVLIILPMIQALRKMFPNAAISVVVQKPYAGLFDFVPAVDKVYAFDRTNSPAGFLRARKTLSKQPFDLLFSMSPSLRNALLTLSTPSVGAIGYFTASDSTTPFLHRTPIQSIGMKIESAEYHMDNIYERAGNICDAMQIPREVNMTWKIGKESVGKTTRILNEQGYTVTRPLVVIHPFAGWSYRQWPLKRFIALADTLAREYNGFVVFIGTEAEFSMNERVFKPEGKDRLIIIETSDVKDLVGVISQAHLFIGNDSGPLHLANLLGIQTIGLFGPASPQLTGNQGNNAAHIYHHVECSPCNQERCLHPDNPCMDQISQEEIMQIVRQYLDKRP